MLLCPRTTVPSTCDTFSYKSVDDVCELMYPGCYMASVDISSAYPIVLYLYTLTNGSIRVSGGSLMIMKPYSTMLGFALGLVMPHIYSLR